MDNMYVMLMEGGQPFTIAMLAPDTKPQSITCVNLREGGIKPKGYRK